MLRTLATGNQVLLAGQKSGVVYGLDPDHGGDTLWQTKIGGGAGTGFAGGGASGVTSAVGPPGVEGSAGGVGWGSAADHRNLYVATTGGLAQPAECLGQFDGAGFEDGRRCAGTHPRRSPHAPGASGNCTHGQSQAVTVMPGSAFSGSMDGHLRAYSTIDGKILWDYDTAKDFQTRNGVKASGGPLDHGGATIVNGVVYVNSGKRLLAFSVDGK